MSRSLLRAAVAVPCALALAFGAAALPAAAAIVDEPVVLWSEDAPFTVAPVGTYETGIFDGGAAEIVTHFAAEQRLLIVNAVLGSVEVLDVSDPTEPAKLFDVQTEGVLSADGTIVPDDATANSVAVRADGLGAIAVEAPEKTDEGWVVFFDAAGDGEALGAVRVGALPDMVTFTPDGTELLVANEGEPSDDYTVDPEGSISIVLVPATVDTTIQSNVRTAGFHEFEAGGTLTLPEDVRVFGPTVNAEFPVSANLEPEYITFSDDSTTAYVTLQEANAIATVDIAAEEVVAIDALGFKDWSASALDPSDEDGIDDEGAIAIRPWPVFGMYQPDGIDSFSVGGEHYLVTANEGDAREWGDYAEEVRAASEEFPICESAFAGFVGQPGYPATVEGFLEGDALGRLNVTTANGYNEQADCYDELYTFGGRSFSVWNDGELVFDSGDAFEQLSAAAAPEFFNSDHAESSFDNRSDNKGPEPEGIVVGEVDGAPYAFIGFERLSGFVAYSLSDPAAPEFVGYFNNRDFAFSSDPDEEDDDAPVVAAAGDTGPEGLAFVAAEDSPTGAPMLAVGNEVSGSTTLYSIVLPDAVPTPGTPDEDDELAATGAEGTAAALAAALLLALAGTVMVRRRSHQA